MYKEFAQTAKEEGFDEIAKIMELIAKIEKEHEERFRTLIQNLAENKVFERDKQVIWVCRNCGHIHIGSKAPEVCPACSHPQDYFEIKAENY